MSPARWAPLIVAALVFAVVALAPAPSFADDDDDDDTAAKAEARKLLSAGDKKLKSGDKLLGRGKKVEAQEAYLAALADYEGAYAAFNDSKIFFAIGLAEKKLGRYVEALGHFDRFLAEVGDNEALRAMVEEHTDEMKEFLGAIFFKIDPDGATVEINGDNIGKSPLNRPHYVPPGEHTYKIARKGFKTVTGTVELEAGESRNDELILERDVSDDEEEDEDPKPEKQVVIVKPEPKNQRPLVVGLALTGSFALAGTVTGLLALSRHGTFEDEGADPADRESARSSGKNLALATDVFVIGAIAAATYTAYYYVVEYRGDGDGKEGRSDGRTAASVSATPWVAPGAGGFAVSGRF